MAAIQLSHVVKRFSGGVTAVADCSLDVEDGQYLVVLGPSGCGKSTLLRLIAGLEQPHSGRISIDGHDVARVPPHRRGVGLVFQDSALYPHMTVRRNLMFPLSTRRIGRDEINRRVAAAAELLRIGSLLDRKPGTLSGGERQRAALGRALITQPRALLLDEPLSQLDAHLRDEMRAELRRVHDTLRTTVIHVTHDQDEADELGRRIAVMAEGAVQQVGDIDALRAEPVNRFVAGFLGRPPMNLLAGRLHDDGANRRLVLAYAADENEPPRRLTLPMRRDAVPGDAIGREVVIGIRPEAIGISDQSSDPGVPVIVEATFRRHEALFVRGGLPGGGSLVFRWAGASPPPTLNSSVSVTWPGGETRFFRPGRFGGAITDSRGTAIAARE